MQNKCKVEIAASRCDQCGCPSGSSPLVVVVTGLNIDWQSMVMCVEDIPTLFAFFYHLHFNHQPYNTFLFVIGRNYLKGF